MVNMEFHFTFRIKVPEEFHFHSPYSPKSKSKIINYYL